MFVSLPYYYYCITDKERDEKSFLDHINSPEIRRMGLVPISENPFFGGYKPRIEDDEDTSRYV